MTTVEKPAQASSPDASVRTLNSIRSTDSALVGGKAASLGELASAGMRVPWGVAITTDALITHLERCGIADALDKLAGEINATSGEIDEILLATLAKSITSTSLSAELTAALQVHLGDRLVSGQAFAVRSSGVQEDLAGASFAGQYESFLGIRGIDALAQAVLGCWASLFAPRVAHYLRHQTSSAALKPRDLAVAVVVQELAPADVAGVLFTVNPISGIESESVVEAVLGLGEALVAGHAPADHFVVTNGEVTVRDVASKRDRIVDDPNGTTRNEEVSVELGQRPSLTDTQLIELCEIGAAVQEHYGQPMDVEWTFGGGAFHLVQARPITQINFDSSLGEWTTADFRDGGVSSDVCTPFMWSLYEYALENSMPQYLRSIKLLGSGEEMRASRMFFARPYWNLLAVKKLLATTPGYSERALDEDLGIQPSYEGDGVTTPMSIGRIVSALPILIALTKSYKERLEINAAFSKGFAEIIAPFDLGTSALEALSGGEFALKWNTLVTERYLECEANYFYTIYNTSNSRLDFSSVFEKANVAAGGELSSAALMGGLLDLSHMRPVADAFALARRLNASGDALTDQDVVAYAARWRQHGRRELDIRVPRWPGDLEFVRSMLTSAIESWRPEGDPALAAQRGRDGYLAERKSAVEAIGWNFPRRRSFEKKLDLVRRYAWWREEMRDHSSTMYAVVRSWTVEAARRFHIGGLLADPEQIWFLGFSDITAALQGGLSADEIAVKVRGGERLFRSFRNFDNPNEIGSRHAFQDAAASDAAFAAAGGNEGLKGNPCAPGRVEGTARVLVDLSQSQRINQGDILVTTFTDPGWTPLFARLGAVVTETGGLLSHAAVIAREYGIPAVLAVPKATLRIPDGARIAVDGRRGTVELLD